MNGEAKELRELANKIDQLVSTSRVASIAWDQTRALCDYLCLRARVMELGAKCDDLERERNTRAQADPAGDYP